MAHKAVAVVAGLELAILAAAVGLAWLWAGAATAQAVAAGGGCAWAGTLAYAVCQSLVPGHSPARLLWGHAAGEITKVAVALGLLVWGLSSDSGYAVGPYLAGFMVALLAYPLALPLLKSK